MIDARGAAVALQAWLLEHHWRGDGLVGPDCGIRLNYRVGRFVKSYLRALPWRDDLYYLQAQGYWTLANWRLADATGERRPGEVAVECARGMVARQRPDGAWDYPNPAWQGRVATAEGSWAAIGLLETYRRTGEEAFLESSIRWHRFVEQRVGFQAARGGLAVNYFAGRSGPAVPNNSAFVLRLLAELADAAKDDRFLSPAAAMLTFLARAQLPSGEMPYQVGREVERVRLFHFQCTQYNAFQCLDLLRYLRLTGDAGADPVVGGLLRFLHGAVRVDGRVAYQCEVPKPEVTYHLAAVAAALQEGARVGEEAEAGASARVLTRFLALQRLNGSFPHSRGDYGFLSDQRSYPRHLAMILFHLLSVDRAPTVVDRDPCTSR